MKVTGKQTNNAKDRQEDGINFYTTNICNCQDDDDDDLNLKRSAG